jgi:cell division protein FtsB
LGVTVKRLWIVPALAAVAIAWALLDGRSGIRAWTHLRSELSAASARMDELRRENASLHHEVESLRDDPVALEAAIRQDLHLARPGEIVVELPPSASREGGATPRIP